MVQCTCPQEGWYSVEGGFTLDKSKAYHDRPLTVRGGRCMGCRLERARVWGVRCTHEASLYDENLFLTMTYDDDHLPYGNTLVRKHVTDFFKRLRRRYPSQKIRHLYCGEYGGETERAHYHAIVFNLWPSDAEFFFRKEGNDYYRSDKIDQIWGLGHCNFGEVTFKSASYVAGYCKAKIQGPMAKEYYQWIDESTGEIIDRLPPFQGQSLKPGIGQPWIEKFMTDVYPRDQIIIDGNPCRPPRYYDQLCEKLRPDLWRKTKRKRWKEYDPEIEDHTWNRSDGSKIREGKRFKERDAYYASDRQMICRDKILKSRMRERNDQ